MMEHIKGIIIGIVFLTAGIYFIGKAKRDVDKHQEKTLTYLSDYKWYVATKFMIVVGILFISISLYRFLNWL